MSWFDIIKRFSGSPEHNMERLNELESHFRSQQDKAIGYLPILWAEGIEQEVENLAGDLNMEYRMFPIKNPEAGLPDGNSFANGGHFIFDRKQIENNLPEEFDSVDNFVSRVATESFIGTDILPRIKELFAFEGTLRDER
jgi:hypothetical protein